MAITPEERILIARVVKRDREAFSQIYVLYHPQVLNRTIAILRNRDEAGDVAGETFLRAWNAIDRFEDRDVSICAWLCKIAERVALKRLRRSASSIDVDTLASFESTDVSLEELAERASDCTEVREALEELPELQRMVLKRRFFDDASYDSVSSELGKSVGAVRVIQHRALSSLKKVLIIKRQGKVGPAGTPQ
ncbi:MAG TPA: sigma-70 family RNA polymerase sigma factor [Dehalococcoidia bacterium]|nr:sigma-70 family RNA polymerase sigma factor [Dehalococcoidia bacterium]